MSDQKPVYLLSGGRGSRDKTTTSVIKEVFKETGKSSPVIAYVGVASQDNVVFFKLIEGMIKQAGKCQVIRVVICAKKADLDKARSLLQSADAVFMSGGDVEAGMKTLDEKDLTVFMQSLYQQGKLFFGASAGSIMLAREWVRWKNPDDESTAELFPCLGLAPVLCDTHAEEDNWEELKAALQLKKDDAIGYGIPTGACLKVSPDGMIEALGKAVSVYVKKGGKVEKLPDMPSK